MPQQYQIGLVIYPDMTPLDIIGPHQVFSFIPDAQVHLLWKTLEPVRSDNGLTVMPTMTFDRCPPLDVICVPGGQGKAALMLDEEVLEFLREQGKTAKYVTSVCTGSLILAAAGLLQGYRAATHWMFREQLALLGVEVVSERVVVDRNRITGGGVTAGIDFGLVVASHLCGEETAKIIQLSLEYNPAPPFDAGSPEKADPALVEAVEALGKELFDISLEATKKAASRLTGS
ncbi:MAG: DJ-1/PfpI family protein [Cyanobacteriota bacterium]|nr:DJ-1/PfpI family protein [Cyanobacteriota bacterium]